MAISKLILNGETQMDVTSNTNAANNMLNGVVGTKNDGTTVTGSIATKTSSDLTASGATVTAPAGYYANAASKAVSTTTHPNPTASIVSSTGVVTASHTQGTGYVTGGTTTGTLNLTTQAGKTITPTETAQTAVASYRWTTGPISVAAIDSYYIGSRVPQNSAADVTIANTTGVVTAPAGYYSTAATKTLTTKAGETFYPSTADQTISSYRWLIGNQTIASVTTTNLVAQNIAEGVVVKVGDANNASRITQVTGTHKSGGYTCTVTNGVLSTRCIKYNNTNYASGEIVFNKDEIFTVHVTGSSNRDAYLYINNKLIIGPVQTSIDYNITPNVDFSVNFTSGNNAYRAYVTIPEIDIIENGTYEVGGYGYANVSLPTQAAQTFYTSTVDQTISSGVYLTGDQTIKGVTTSNLTAENIAEGVVVQVGDSSNASRIAQITGTYTPPTLAFPTATSSTRVGSDIAGIYPSPRNQFLNIPTGYNSSSQAYILYHVQTTNLTAENIVAGVTVKVGDQGDASRITQVTGTYTGGEYYSVYQAIVDNTILSYNIIGFDSYIMNLSSVKSQMFEDRQFSTGTYEFTNTNIIGRGAFACPTRTAWNFASINFIFPSCSDIGSYAFTSRQYLYSINAPVCTNIGNNAFLNCYSLTTISFPSCTYIGPYAFQSCSSLITASFPSCSYIGAGAFSYCSSLITASFPSCSDIGSSAFVNCYSLTTISFPACTSIRYNAFGNCSSLIIASFPSCTNIVDHAFRSCYSLTTADFPACTNIGGGAFAYCFLLTTISFPSCTNIGGSAFSYCSSLTTADFPACTNIGAGAFAYCYSLTTADFPACTTIEDYAFSGCLSLTTISFPVCTTIGNYAFYSCRSLSTVNFPACINISAYAFSNCINLTTASFSACTNIGSYAFRYCYNLLSLYLLGSSIPTLASTNAFISTPISTYTTSTGGVYGNIYVPSSLYSSYLTATNWSYYSSRFVSV